MGRGRGGFAEPIVDPVQQQQIQMQVSHLSAAGVPHRSGCATVLLDQFL